MMMAAYLEAVTAEPQLMAFKESPRVEAVLTRKTSGIEMTVAARTAQTKHNFSSEDGVEATVGYCRLLLCFTPRNYSSNSQRNHKRNE